jgi:hypothetical protein
MALERLLFYFLFFIFFNLRVFEFKRIGSGLLIIFVILFLLIFFFHFFFFCGFFRFELIGKWLWKIKINDMYKTLTRTSVAIALGLASNTSGPCRSQFSRSWARAR